MSLSVRVAETPCKTRLYVPFEEIVAIARDTGFAAICLRASAGGIGTSVSRLEQMRRCLDDAGIRVSMVTADNEIPLNNSRGPDSLRNIRPSLDVAEIFGCGLIRVCLKQPDDIPWARTAAEIASARKIRLAHQCHTSSLFEEVDPMLRVLSEIGSPNFGLIFEPANLMVCGQPYGRDTLRKLQPHVMNVYVQNHRTDPQGTDALTTFCRGEVRFHHLELWEDGGIDFAELCAGLVDLKIPGYFTIHQAQGIRTAEDVRGYAARCVQFFRPLLSADSAGKGVGNQ